MTKILSKEETGECQSWVLPTVGNAARGNPAPPSGNLTARQLEELQKQAYEEAYAEGLQSAKVEIQQEIQRFGSIVKGLSAPFKDLDKQVDEELVTLVIALVKQMVRREIKSDPGQIMAVVREAIESLPVASRDLQLRFHPEDAALVQKLYKISEEAQAWDIVEDPLISRGGCKIITSVSQVDATLETRLNQLFAEVFGERQQDSEQDVNKF